MGLQGVRYVWIGAQACCLRMITLSGVRALLSTMECTQETEWRGGDTIHVMKIVQDSSKLELDRSKAISFVPTMGALHPGHAACIEEAASLSEQVVVSIYVNPTQFNQGQDLKSYPHHLEQDIVLAQQHGATLVYTPDDEQIYPDGIDAAREQAESIPLPDVACKPGLEDRCRPGHLAGVIQVPR